MDDIVIFEGAELADLIDRLQELVEHRDSVYRLRFAVDGGLKIKVNEATWSPPLSRVEVW